MAEPIWGWDHNGRPIPVSELPKRQDQSEPGAQTTGRLNRPRYKGPPRNEEERLRHWEESQTEGNYRPKAWYDD